MNGSWAQQVPHSAGVTSCPRHRPHQPWRGPARQAKARRTPDTTAIIPAVLVPVSALYRDGENWAVFVERNGEAARTVVKIAGRNAELAWAESGLQPGEAVIVYPSDSVSHGGPVKVVRRE